MQEQINKEKQRSRSKSPAIRGLNREKAVSNDLTQADQAPSAATPPIFIQNQEEVKVSLASSSGEQRELETLKFDLRQTLKEHNLDNYSIDQVKQVKNVVVDFFKGKLTDLNNVRKFCC
jgi:hypothetical protein